MDSVERLIEEYLDGRLTDMELTELSRALEKNPAAAFEFTELVQLSRALEALHCHEDREAVDAIMAELPDRADEFVSGVMDELADEVSLRGKKPRWRVALTGWSTLPRLALAASFATLLIVCTWLLVPSRGAPRISRLVGSSAQLHRGVQSLPVVGGMAINPGDIIETGPASTAVLSFDGEQTLFGIKPASRLEISSWRRGKRLGLSQGTIEATVARQKAFRPLIIETPNASARVLGTEFTLTATTNRTQLDVAQGRVSLTDTTGSNAVTVYVAAGQWAVVAPAMELSALPRTGGIMREYWTNIPGAIYVTFLYTNANFPNRPSGSEFLNNFAAPANWGDNFGDRMRGYLIPPQTGDYSFWIAGNPGAELWFSPDSNPENKRQVAFTTGVASREWDQSPSQRSATLHLAAGRLYYLEALRKCGVGEDYLSVGWQPPGGQREVIPGRYLAPFKPKK